MMLLVPAAYTALLLQCHKVRAVKSIIAQFPIPCKIERHPMLTQSLSNQLFIQIIQLVTRDLKSEKYNCTGAV